jgi:hypothetical protein
MCDRGRYPCGLPIKFADGAKVTLNTNDQFFKATLDAYGGNSGSPVFGSNNIVEGVLVRGKPYFMPLPKSNCMQSAVWPDTGADGEDCTRTTVFAQLVSE